MSLQAGSLALNKFRQTIFGPKAFKQKRRNERRNLLIGPISWLDLKCLLSLSLSEIPNISQSLIQYFWPHEKKSCDYKKFDMSTSNNVPKNQRQKLVYNSLKWKNSFVNSLNLIKLFKYGVQYTFWSSKLSLNFNDICIFQIGAYFSVPSMIQLNKMFSKIVFIPLETIIKYNLSRYWCCFKTSKDTSLQFYKLSCKIVSI